MPKYIIEREIPGAGSMSIEELTGISEKSRTILQELGTKIQWVHSYVTTDKIYCVYILPNEEFIKKHGELGGFPVDRISEIKSIIDPTSA